jgi:hypothetical protein
MKSGILFFIFFYNGKIALIPTLDSHRFYSEHIQHRTPWFHKKTQNTLCRRQREKKAFDCMKLIYIFVQNPELVVSIATCGRPKPPNGRRQATREPGGPEPLSIGPAGCTHPEVRVRWTCHLPYT